MQASQDRSTKLYTPTLLALSVELAAYPHDPNAALQGRAKSRTCGSEIVLSASNSELGQLGLQVTACAVGQASAALFAANASNQTATKLEQELDEMTRWLSGEGAAPDLPRIGLLEPARDYPGRHEAILLPWRAAFDALA